MSKHAPEVGLLARYGRLKAAGGRVEALAAEYHAALRPIREAVQAVADAPPDDRDRWSASLASLAAAIAEAGLSELPAEMRGYPGFATD